MKFNKQLWLNQIDLEIAQGLHSQKDKDNALETWVNDLDGKEIDNTEENAGLIRFCED